MIRKLSLLALASVAALAGCATSPYGYRDGGGDYYYGRTSSAYGSAGYGYPGGAYGSVGYGYPGYGYPRYGSSYGYGSPYGYYGYAPRYGSYGYPYYPVPYRQVIVVQPQPGSPPPPPSGGPRTPEQSAELKRQINALRARKHLAPTPSMPMPASAGVAASAGSSVAFPGRQTQRVTHDVRPDAGMRTRRSAAEAPERPLRVRSRARDGGLEETP